jgi:hypothetical protein
VEDQNKADQRALGYGNRSDAASFCITTSKLSSCFTPRAFVSGHAHGQNNDMVRYVVSSADDKEYFPKTRGDVDFAAIYAAMKA